MKYRPTKSAKWTDFRRNRRIIQEYGLEEARKTGALKTEKQIKEENKKLKKQIKAQKQKDKQTHKAKSSIRVGENYETEYNKFIINGGDITSCPFD